MSDDVKFEVWSGHYDEGTDEVTAVLEVTRTSKAVAQEDVQLIRSILHRPARIQEVE